MSDVTRKGVDHMLSAAYDAAPTGTEQEAFGRVVNDMRAAGESDKSIVVALAGYIRDGLMYGNWPS